MKRYVVGYISLFDHELKLELVEAENEHEAFWKHSELQSPDWDGLEKETEGMDAAQLEDWSFDFDMVVAVLELS